MLHSDSKVVTTWFAGNAFCFWRLHRNLSFGLFVPHHFQFFFFKSKFELWWFIFVLVGLTHRALLEKLNRKKNVAVRGCHLLSSSPNPCKNVLCWYHDTIMITDCNSMVVIGCSVVKDNSFVLFFWKLSKTEWKVHIKDKMFLKWIKVGNS